MILDMSDRDLLCEESLPDGGILSVDISVHDVVASDSTKVFEILLSSQD